MDRTILHWFLEMCFRNVVNNNFSKGELTPPPSYMKWHMTKTIQNVLCNKSCGNGDLIRVTWNHIPGNLGNPCLGCRGGNTFTTHESIMYATPVKQNNLNRDQTESISLWHTCHPQSQSYNATRKSSPRYPTVPSPGVGGRENPSLFNFAWLEPKWQRNSYSFIFQLSCEQTIYTERV